MRQHRTGHQPTGKQPVSQPRLPAASTQQGKPSTINSKAHMIEVRCKRCSKLLAKALFQQIEIKCTRCKTINSMKAKEPLTAPRVPR